jgi:hypothetical protein
MTSREASPQEGAQRELRVEDVIDAPPEQVWALLTDFSRMPDWSPELVRMVPLKPGGLRVGQWYLGVNRRKAVVWPTRSVVAAVDPGRRLVCRPVPRRLTGLSRVFATAFLGGTDGHADELEDGMAQTVGRLRAAVEATARA